MAKAAIILILILLSFCTALVLIPVQVSLSRLVVPACRNDCR